MAIYKTLVKKISVPSAGKIKRKDYKEKGLLAVIDQGQQLIGGYTDNIEKKVNCELPVLIFGDHTRIVKYIDFPFGSGADGTKILQAKDIVLPKYLYYGTQYLTLIMSDRGYARHYQYIEKMDLPVPTHDEQKRIVCHIEELFSKLDAGKETLKNIKQQLDVYRQAVLKEAFSGCEHIKLQDVCQSITDGDHMPPPKSKKGIPFIMISNINNHVINWENTAYVGKDYFDAISDTRKPKQGDVLYTVTGSFGIPVLIDFEKDFCFQRHIALLRPNEIITQKFLYYALQSPYVYAQASKRATGTAQKTVGLNVLRELEIPYVSSKEKQREIVIDIENKLSVYENIAKVVENALLQAEAMHQSILKSAFEGRLSS
ncbi:MAG: restriction endonuclease subunit S [Butyrivibrio sp.]|nr:restriction endonuclease subunit S [Butyrivibrio sp.]